MESIPCPNPSCPSRQSVFGSQKAFEMHLTKNGGVCIPFIPRNYQYDADDYPEEQGPSKRPRPKTNDQSHAYDSCHENMQALPVDSQDMNNHCDKDSELDSEWDHYDPFYNDEEDVPGISVFQDEPMWYTGEQAALIDLMKLVQDMNAPDYAFRKILEWAQRSVASGFDFNPEHGLNKKVNMKWMVAMTSNADKRLPTVEPVSLADGEVAEVVCFDFKAAALSVLQNRSIMKKENLVIDWNDPTAKYIVPDGLLREPLSGSVYQDNFHKFITDKARPQLVCPIISWFDRTHVTESGRFTLQPYMMTFAIFTEKFRRTLEAWFVLGFMPASKASSAEKKTYKQGQSLRDYHKQLDKLFETYRDCPRVLENIQIPIGPNGSTVVDLIMPMLYIIQDMEEGDKLCGRFGTHQKQVKRHNRACNVNFNSLSNPWVRCKFVTARHMKK